VAPEDGRGAGPSTPWAPDEAFAAMLQYGVIPTFDVILHGPDGVLLVRRRISPYANMWALPGLRILKGETIEVCLHRIARDEVGIDVNPAAARFVSQAVVKFSSNYRRQDLSSCYGFEIGAQTVKLNEEHLSDWTFAWDMDSLPTPIGELYRAHLSHYFASLDSK
jgi:ADP-ribose pyrophosphatase YjhB (NUDIX family)